MLFRSPVRAHLNRSGLFPNVPDAAHNVCMSRSRRARFAVAAILGTVLTANASSAEDKTALLASTGKALEDQLACVRPPKPALAIRAMMMHGLIARTKFGADGSPVFQPTGDLQVFGAKVLFVTGWEMEGDRVREPFWRGPGTAPPLFLSVVVDALPANMPYREHMVRGRDGVAIGSFSSIETAREYYATSGTTITCYGG